MYGINWSVHPLFVLVMLASIATGYFVELITLFAIVLVHEIGHVLAAKGFGWTVHEVKLLPFGGVAEVEEGANLPAREDAIVAIAGPLQNVWMGALAWAFGETGLWNQEWSLYVMHANIMIGLFNLLPILPLDGGKLLQAALSRMMPHRQTLVWMGRISLVLSCMMIIFAVIPAFHEPGGGIQANLLAVGLFLLLTNWTAYRHIPFLFIRFLTHRADVSSRSMALGGWALPIVVSKRHSIASALRLFRRDSYHLIVVMEEPGNIVAVLPEQQLVNGYLAEGKADRAVLELFM
ncbi:stage IV sporulation protein FB [Paenibacillus nasutitermitis]|uniref:Stage IV sporulation protein FB n=1 Tax=Paenibacillus nasutitermitis TaxID=1652958 RepID=A0A916YPB4_9BACL|nr:stage IV sporulation protein FB [Paenibacillus nasutitermitis]